MSVVGWDWASQAHDVTVLDDAGAVLDRWAFPHAEVGWAMALARLGCQGEPGDLPVIIEKTSGLIVDRLLAAGHPVVPVHPNAFHAARPRWGASGAKSDPGDSYKLADYLRTDGHRLRRVEPTDPGLRELQAWCGCVRTRSVPGAAAPPPSAAPPQRRYAPTPDARSPATRDERSTRSAPPWRPMTSSPSAHTASGNSTDTRLVRTPSPRNQRTHRSAPRKITQGKIVAH
jgi:transposase